MDTTINITCPQSGLQISIRITVSEHAEHLAPEVDVVDNTKRPADPVVRPSVRPADPVVRPTPTVGSGGRIDAPAGKNSYDTSTEEKSESSKTPYRNVRRPR